MRGQRYSLNWLREFLLNSGNVKDVGDTETFRRKEEMPKLNDKFKDWTKSIDKLLKETPVSYPNRAKISESI